MSKLNAPALSGLLLLLWSSIARPSDISYVDIYGNQLYTQTGNGNALTFDGDYFFADLNSTVANPYTSASFTYPGPGSPQALNELSPPSADYHFQTGLFSSLSAMDTAYPFGTYAFQGGTTDTATLGYTANDYPLSSPYLTGTNYTSLQGMNPAQSFTFDFSPFDTGSNASDSYIFLSIYNVDSGAEVFTDGFLPATTTSAILPGGTLGPDTEYEYQLDYSNRNIVSGTGGQYPPEIGSDIRTDGVFTTAAVPEPGSYTAVLAAGFVVLLLLRRRGTSLAPIANR
jgi:hypothetical protein